MRSLVAPFALALAACVGPHPATQDTAASGPTSTSPSPSWETARAAGVDFRGIGQEPGWLLDIYAQNHIVLDWNYGEQRAIFPLPEPTYPVEGATRYETQADGHTLVVTTRRFPCQDAMSGEAFPATVEVVIDGAALQGCGRSV